jgi:hypothetical protein
MASADLTGRTTREKLVSANPFLLIAEECPPALGRRISSPDHVLATLVCPIPTPSLSNSPWIRGAPHGGLAMLISRISVRISPTELLAGHLALSISSANIIGSQIDAI